MKREAPPTEHVTTEPQRLALEAMSQDLVKKLNCMVAEQEARAREFAAHQHSLSSLPVQTPPVAPTTTIISLNKSIITSTRPLRSHLHIPHPPTRRQYKRLPPPIQIPIYPPFRLQPLPLARKPLRLSAAERKRKRKV